MCQFRIVCQKLMETAHKFDEESFNQRESYRFYQQDANESVWIAFLMNWNSRIAASHSEDPNKLERENNLCKVISHISSTAA